MLDYERLGIFYLGQSPSQSSASADLLLYDSKDLLTHAVCLGMTGSGKTGLCLSLIEEAAIDGIPVIAIDPKGDISNLLLTFPELSREEFLPWINEDEARRQGLSPEQFADSQAKLWRTGLQETYQGPARIKLLADSAEFLIYTPGSAAGLPVSVLSSLDPPNRAGDDLADHFTDKINQSTSALLTLLGEDIDPLTSKEHILVANILENAWKAGQSLTLAQLIERIQKPPFDYIGALDIESFFPAKKRFDLAVSFNNLLAAPTFAAWQEGEPLDFGKLLYNASGRPRVLIFSIAHLSENQRMFFVTLALNQLIDWMRGQSGTTSLRAIFYMDEIFGYFPPVANPPAKQPLLTLLKQARAYGLGLVLASQNPVDLDYKGLANAGTWFIGRLQTERDKARVLEGLEGAAAEGGAKFDRQAMERKIAGLASRVFLVNNVHQGAPAVFKTRWTLSYLRGPLTREQIKKLMEPQKHRQASGKDSAPQLEKVSAPAEMLLERPTLSPQLEQFFAPITKTNGAKGQVFYQPRLLASISLHFLDAKAKLDWLETRTFLACFHEEGLPVDWNDSKRVNLNIATLAKQPVSAARFARVPLVAAKPENYKNFSKQFLDWVVGSQRTYLFKSSALSEYSKPNEGEREFRIRLTAAINEERDQAITQLNKKYAAKMATLEAKMAAAQAKLDGAIEKAKEEEVQSAVSIGTTVLGAILRRRISASTIDKAGSAVRRASKSAQKRVEVSSQEEALAAIEQEQQALEAEIASQIKDIRQQFDAQSHALETVSFNLKKSQLSLQLFGLIWLPYALLADGTATPLS
ncbi:MAG: ATP-binding protein [Candidatus Melainabacteria bacterium]|nr:MAG: ATP-binding protein [Candidatus Melainabacteria bacterium]